MTTQNWVSEFLRWLASAALEHPLLVASVVIIAAISAVAHVITLTGYAILGLSPFLRGQAADFKRLVSLFAKERQKWKREVFVARVKSLPSNVIKQRLEIERIDVDTTARAVDAIIVQVVAQLRREAEEAASIRHEKLLDGDSSAERHIPEDGAA